MKRDPALRIDFGDHMLTLTSADLSKDTVAAIARDTARLIARIERATTTARRIARDIDRDDDLHRLAQRLQRSSSGPIAEVRHLLQECIDDLDREGRS